MHRDYFMNEFLKSLYNLLFDILHFLFGLPMAWPCFGHALLDCGDTPRLEYVDSSKMAALGKIVV